MDWRRNLDLLRKVSESERQIDYLLIEMVFRDTVLRKKSITIFPHGYVCREDLLI